MTTPPTRRRARRACAGLAAAAVTAAGLTCQPAAAAPDMAAAAATPVQLAFAPQDLLVVGTDVYAAGSAVVDEDDDGEPEQSNGILTRTGDQATLDLGPGTTATAVADGGDSVWVLGTEELPAEAGGEPLTDYKVWVVNPVDLGVLREMSFPDGSYPTDIVGTGGEVFATGTGPGSAEGGDSVGTNWLLGDGIHAVADLGPGASPDVLVALTTGGILAAAGTQWDQTSAGTPTVWVSGPGAEPSAMQVGADGHDNATELAVDDAGTGYVFSRDQDGGYGEDVGLTVLDGTAGEPRYVPLSEEVTAMAVSGDGDTLFLATNNGLEAHDTAALGSYDEDNPAPVSFLDNIYAPVIALGNAGEVHVADHDGQQVRTLSAPEAPDNVAAAPHPMSTTEIAISWEQGKHDFELVDAGADWQDLPEYVVTVQAETGEPVVLDPTRHQVNWLDGLEPGTTYEVSVTAVAGAFRSPVARTTVSTHARHLDAPSAVTVQGSMTVGGQLSLKPTGAWEAGTDLAYEWYGSSENAGGPVGQGPTLRLTKDHIGMQITGVVTGTRSDAAGVQLHAGSTTKVASGVAVQVPGTPSVSGAATVGKRLTATGTWPAGTTLSYRWTANGKVIAGETGSSLKVTKRLSGKRIAVVVTAAKAGFTTVTTESASTPKVRTAKQAKKAAKKAKAKAKKAKQKAKKRAKKRAQQNRS